VTLPPFLSVPALAARHGFFTREGGVSTGAFAALNGSLGGQDARENVLENRARAARALGADPALMVGLTQVHGAAVVPVETPWAPGAGPAADAMVTARGGVALAIVTADCAPVLFADAAAGVIGAAHAGWRGALAGVLEATVAAMVTLGARREAIKAAIGPCIAQRSYEVGADLRAAVLAQDPGNERFFLQGRDPAHWQFDLPGFCAARLAAAGIAGAALPTSDTVTEEARFFSHRRRVLAGGGAIGHQMSVIVL
jgi:YfiH family protein